MSAITDYLTLFYRQRHINKMPDDVWQTFLKYDKNDGLLGHMKKWKADLMHYDADGNLVRNDLPTPDNFEWTRIQDKAGDSKATNKFTDADWEELFDKLQNIFTRMYINMKKDKFEEPAAAAKNFVNDFYDPNPAHGKLFSLPPLDQDTKDGILKFVTEIVNNDDAKTLFQDVFDSDIGKNGRELKKFKDDMNARKYETDANFREKLSNVLNRIQNNIISGWGYYADDENARKLKAKINALNFNAMIEALRAPAKIDPKKLDQFKNQIFMTSSQTEGLPYYQAILSRIHDKSGVTNELKKCESYGESEISESLEKAKSLTDYTGKTAGAEKDEVVPAENDTKNIIDRIKDKIDDTYTDTLKRYRHLHRDHIYFKQEAQIIMEAIDKLKGDDGKPITITPKDGIGAILKNADAITKALKKKSAGAKDHFEWFVKTLNEMEPKTKKAFANALRNGNQMHKVIEKLIIKAVESEPKKIAEAKTAMEVLTVMQYGAFTSRTMDALKQADFTLFSDSGLSLNNNDGIKFVTGALDGTIKFGTMVAGYAATAAANKLFRRVGKKFNHYDGELQKRADDENKGVAAELITFQQTKAIADTADNDAIKDQDKILTKLKNKYKIDATTIDAKKQKLEKWQQVLTNKYEKKYKKESATVDKYVNLKAKYDKLLAVDNSINALNANIQSLNTLPRQQEINKLDQQIKNQNIKIKKLNKDIADMRSMFNDPAHDAEIQSKQDELDALKQEKDQWTKKKKSIKADIAAHPVTDEDLEQQQLLAETKQQLQEKQDEKKQLLGKDTFTNIETQYNKVFKDKKINGITEYDDASNKKNAAEQAYQKKKAVVDKLAQQITEYENAVENKATLEKAIRTRADKEASWEDDHKNNYVELMAYWDFLQTGNTKSLFHLSTKKLQEKMNKKINVNGVDMTEMEHRYAKWKSDHGYAA